MVTTRTIKDLIAEHALLAHLPTADHDLIAGCGQNVHLPAGRFLFREGEPADIFYLVRDGRVAIEVPTPAGQSLVVATTGPAAWSAGRGCSRRTGGTSTPRAMDDVSAVAIDGACLRAKCEADNGLGYRLMQCFAQLADRPPQGTRRQLLDVYGDHAS